MHSQGKTPAWTREFVASVMWLFPHWTLPTETNERALRVCRIIRAEGSRDLAATVCVAKYVTFFLGTL